MKFYYALFKQTKEAVEVEFPDLPGCVTYAKDWDTAVVNATDVLAGWLANAEPAFVNEPSHYDDLKTMKGTLMPITVDEKVMASYQELKRFNVIFPSTILSRIDTFRKKIGLKRSTFLQKAAEEYLVNHAEKT